MLYISCTGFSRNASLGCRGGLDGVHAGVRAALCHQFLMGADLGHADMILVIEEGRVAEVGTHQELVARGGAYARMNAIQSAAATQGGIA